MLDVRIRSKAFGSGAPVLRDVAFAVAPGERVAVLGPSGTGKSTLLRIALGLDRAFTGEVRCAAERVGAMFQEPRLLPWLTVADNLRLVARDGEPAPDAAELLDRVALAGVEGLFPRQLSLGMARRVSLARALAVRPDLLVLDEPFASLDPASSVFLGEVAASAGATMLVATHDLAHALGFATRVLVLGGAPATLAGDCAVPEGGERGALADALRATFPFLAWRDDAPAGSDRLPAASAHAYHPDQE